MPLHGKIVVIKRSGGDGTEFPLTASCLFGRKPDCDIRIQLPQVSKEHCRIDFNENKEIILTNLSSVNPTRVNGEALQQAERLKHGDVITVIDRSFRFEFPPAPTPKKRSSIGGKTETLKVQNQQVGAAVTTETGEKRTSDVSTDPHLKDGTNHENIQRPLEAPAEADELPQNKTASPFSDLYQMIKQSLDVKTPRKSCATVPQTPTSRLGTPGPASVRRDDGKPVPSTQDKSTAEKDEAAVSSVADETVAEAEIASDGTPKSAKKQRRSFAVPSAETTPAGNAAACEAAPPPKRSRTPPKRFTACEVASPKSPVRRRSKEVKPAEEEEAVTSPKVDRLGKESPEGAGTEQIVKVMTRKRKSDELGGDLPVSQMKRKRVSFGGSLCPELFDKRLPPNSPLQKGAAPRRSLSVSQQRQSLLRRASATGPPQSKNASPKSGKTSPKSKSPSPARGRSPTVQGRFSVSLISTPSPAAEDAAGERGPCVHGAPRVTPRRRSLSRSRSGISRASMKIKNSWAEIVRFGQTKVKPAAPAKKTVAKKTAKKAVAKPQAKDAANGTPARKLCVHVSTGHADSPVTIVVGRAHRQKVPPPAAAAPKLVPNIALLKMDEDLTGISEMLKTPANERRKTCAIGESAGLKTLAGSLCTSVVEPSVLNTPEEPGEMMVSPLTLSSAVKDRSYSSDAVQRLFDTDQEPGLVGDAAEESSEQLKNTTTAATPKQKPELPECLTGVKRMMRTPRQRAEPVEDLRGKILKTPKQKAEQQERLSGVKRMMETPRQEAGPAEDSRGGHPGGLAEVEAPEAADVLAKTPAHVPEPEDSPEIPDEPVKSPPAGKRMAKTPKEKSAPVEDMVGLKRLMKTPREKGDAVEEDFGIERLVKTPGAPLEVSEGPGELRTEPSAHAEASEVVEEAARDCEEDVARELVFALEGPRDDVPSDVADVPQADKEDEVVVDDHLEKCGAAVEQNSSVEAVDEKLSEERPEEDAAAVEVPEVETTASEPDHKESLKTVASPAAEAAEACDEAVVLAPVRARRGKKSDAAAPPAVRQATRGRKAKPQESAADDQPEQVTETSARAVSHQTAPVEEEESAPPQEEAVVKTPRGRKSKPAAVKQSDAAEDASLAAAAPPQKSTEKPTRGRKPKADAVGQSEEAEDVAMETKQQPQPPARAKRGRTAKQEEEEKPESSSVEATKHQEPAKKLKRTRKAEQEHVEVQAVDMDVPEEAEVQVTEQAKPKRGGRRAAEVKEVPLKRGKRGKQAPEEGGATSVGADHQEKNQPEPEAPVMKPSRARGAKPAAPEAVPAKRARRGAAPFAQEPLAEAAVPVPEPAAASVAPAKRGRRAAGKPAAAAKDPSEAAAEDTKTSKRSVKWKAELEVVEIPKATPVKAARGRKSKLGGQVDAESKNLAKDADPTEEKDLSGKAAEAQPAKKSRRAPMVAVVTADEAESAGSGESKTRRGRAAKK
uniref:proliferation marker protein Ki-67 isoform X1 n=2 Tax=Gasterosteus aculeatus aculeatus TaxID=481459 RepID=UPI001A98B2B9|nr:proliferation marker protein Ki-67 isoform X1 [Gasterosteus aculeatus aculeatus]XP_040032779.1 proliferation marker protein Ki-67 isoform X1 [Gasterosteus aculeatus aculeatus]XP_040032780.1 proliferation marker protein Ki-67 isoform X1 [Gasterosteus aculeatus aculeatus]